MDDIFVSVMMVCYNQEPYIERAIRSIANQKTKYKFELIVGDDASKDGTADIIRRMQKEYPEIVKPVLREKNIGATKNSYDILSKAQGDYIAFCDGDDAWIEGDRIDRQVDFLESHREYSAICSKTKVIDENDNDIDKEVAGKVDFWSFGNSDYSLQDFENWKMPGHISAVLGRNFFKTGDCSLIYKAHEVVGDRTDMLLFLQDGPIYCDNEIVSYYRLKMQGENFVSQYQNKNLRYEDYCMMDNLEKGLMETRGTKVDLSKANMQRFVGAVVIWLKDKSDYNRQVIEKIYEKADDKKRLKKLYRKTVFLKSFYWKVLHKGKSIKFGGEKRGRNY